jgi:hypothetical protein
MSTQKPDPLAMFARIFWNEAIKQVLAEIEAEDKARAESIAAPAAPRDTAQPGAKP